MIEMILIHIIIQPHQYFHRIDTTYIYILRKFIKIINIIFSPLILLQFVLFFSWVILLIYLNNYF